MPSSSPSSSTVSERCIGAVFLGHCHHGKTTLGTALLLAASAAQPGGASSFLVTNVFRHDCEELSRSHTLFCHYAELRTKRFTLSLIDTPGHPNHQKGALVGMHLAEIAIVAVSVAPLAFESGMDEDVGTTRDHVIQAFAMGIKHFIFVLTKIDTFHTQNGVDEAQRRCRDIRNRLESLCEEVGVDAGHRWFTACSATRRWNIVAGDTAAQPDPTPSCPAQYLYAGGETEQPSVLELVEKAAVSIEDSLKDAVANCDEQPFAMSILDRNYIRGVGEVFLGKIVSGSLSVGDEVVITPNAVHRPEAPQTSRSRVFEIERFHCSLPTRKAMIGDFVGVRFRLWLAEYYTRECRSCRGQMLVHHHDRNDSTAPLTLGGRPPLPPPPPPNLIVQDFTAEIKLVRAPNGLREGQCVIVYVGCRQVQCKILRIVKVMKRKQRAGQQSCAGSKPIPGNNVRACVVASFSSQKPTKKQRCMAAAGDRVTVVFAPQQFLAASCYNKADPLGRLGRFVFRDSVHTMGFGAISHIHSPWQSPQVVFQVNIVLRRVLPFELVHVILTFASKFAPVKLGS